METKITPAILKFGSELYRCRVEGPIPDVLIEYDDEECIRSRFAAEGALPMSVFARYRKIGQVGPTPIYCVASD